ncbi:MAG: M48 family metalloprotease [Pseudomonadota bacterium]
MFGNFIYFIIVILIFSTYPPAERLPLPILETTVVFLLKGALFAALVQFGFRRLRVNGSSTDLEVVDDRFSTLQTQFMIMSILMFAMDVYGLGLPSLFSHSAVLRMFPTVLAAHFLLLYIGYAAIVWHGSYSVYRLLTGSQETRGQYIRSNITFAIPVLIPWFLISVISDLLLLVPYPPLQAVIKTPSGEMSFFLVFLFIVAVIGPAIIQRFWRCVPVGPGDVRNRIAALCLRAGIGYRDILYWPIHGGRMITAGVMGLARRFRYILVTEALVDYLSPEEFDAVIAHEIGHVKKRHLLFYLLFFAGYVLISFAVYDLILFLLVYFQPLYSMITFLGGDDPAAVTSIVFSAIIIGIFLLYFRFVFGYFMRNFERQADTYVYALFPSGIPLIRTLEKIGFSGHQRPDKPNWHHFSITQRIDYMTRCESDRSWIARHNRKIRNSMAAYLVVLAGFAVLGYHLHYSDSGALLDHHLLETVVRRELERHPEDPDLYGVLGDLLQNKGAITEAVRAYDKALKGRPDAPRVLNNLAWLLATSDDEHIRDPDRALLLAKRAAELLPGSYVLDTLAECHYINGNLSEALSAAEAAMAAADTNQAYYRAQIAKIKSAMTDDR